MVLIRFNSLQFDYYLMHDSIGIDFFSLDFWCRVSFRKRSQIAEIFYLHFLRGWYCSVVRCSCHVYKKMITVTRMLLGSIFVLWILKEWHDMTTWWSSCEQTYSTQPKLSYKFVQLNVMYAVYSMVYGVWLSFIIVMFNYIWILDN